MFNKVLITAASVATMTSAQQGATQTGVRTILIEPEPGTALIKEIISDCLTLTKTYPLNTTLQVILNCGSLTAKGDIHGLIVTEVNPKYSFTLNAARANGEPTKITIFDNHGTINIQSKAKRVSVDTVYSGASLTFTHPVADFMTIKNVQENARVFATMQNDQIPVIIKRMCGIA